MNTESSNEKSQGTSQIEALAAKRIRHTRVNEVMTELDTLIYPGSQDSILLVCGPSGAGKTTLARHMVDAAIRRAHGELEAKRGIIPAIYTEAPSSGENDFSWRLFYQRILAQLDDDADSPKLVYGIDPESGRMNRSRAINRGTTLAALRTAVERGLRARQVQFLVIDEAAHIIRQTHGRNRLEIQLDTLKSLANLCGTQMVLIGSYDLYNLVSLSGQLARRIHVVHFERYRQDRPEDAQAFARCVSGFEKTLPELWGGKLTRHTKALHENTLGCIGTLSGVLVRAARLASMTNAWTTASLQRAFLTRAQHNRILEEILDGEAGIGPNLMYSADEFQLAS
ncbi:AAA family ATPase [Paraburkholderia phenoliruptrix]|uniref:AAA family ATPase n=1 Tax=Paraburkholderia phenoliruptrix TaxID=252970 RepID=UPI002869992F|nr:AAA family ATPase [Paraburkholderia phenoliruptrix]WMY11089.1 AAA family ATPase [Paraburkholderia phenoliruptrix]